MSAFGKEYFYVRLNSNLKTNHPFEQNTAANFSNTLVTPTPTEDHKIAVVDMHINGQLYSYGLKTVDDFTLTIVEELPPFKEVMNKILNKWKLYIPIDLDTDRSYRIIKSWSDGKVTERYNTTVSLDKESKHVPIMVSTDIVFRTSYTEEFLKKAREIKSKPVSLGLTDNAIRSILESDLRNYSRGIAQTSYTYEGENITVDNDFFKNLVQLRIKEYKEIETEKVRECKLDDLIAKLEPDYVDDREINKVNLGEFLYWLEGTLNMHPLYNFYTVDQERSGVKANVTISSNRKLVDKIGDVEFTFSEKVRKILQMETAYFNMVEGLTDVNVVKEIKLEYGSYVTAYIECNIIKHSTIGDDTRRIIKTIQLEKQKNNKVKFSKHFPYMEFHDCDTNSITEIRIQLTDKNYNPLRFKNRQTSLTLRGVKKSSWLT